MACSILKSVSVGSIQHHGQLGSTKNIIKKKRFKMDSYLFVSKESYLGANKSVSRSLERSLHRKPRYSPPIGKNIRGVGTFLHVITHDMRGVEPIHPPMSDISYKSVIMVIVLIVYRMRVIILLEFLLTITPYACSLLCVMGVMKGKNPTVKTSNAIKRFSIISRIFHIIRGIYTCITTPRELGYILS